MRTLFIGQNAIHLTAVDSTNSYASEMLRQIRPAEGTIIYTFEQNKGRGQRGNSWLSESSKNVALSLILHPSFLAVHEQFMLSKMVSLAVADLMAEMLPEHAAEVKIKWPNDVYITDKKIAGILIENTLSGNAIQSSVIGTGININQTDFKELSSACSMRLVSGKEHDLMSVIEQLCVIIEARYLQLKANKHEQLDQMYLNRLYQLNEWKYYIAHNERFEGKITGVSAGGKLQVEKRNSGIREFDLKEIAFV
jgi:BirA family biotin operon repressor/biotin-[acetyl-CoA-carboxylase] ligase